MTGLRRSVHSTPLGPLLVVASPEGVVHASGWTTDIDAITALMAPGRSTRCVYKGIVPHVSAALDDYFAGSLSALAGVEVEQRGGPFIEAAWTAMRAIEPGRPLSYSSLAAQLPNPHAIRAVGTACARNASAPFIPCHRLLRSDGGLGGYRWGLERKRWLLDHEYRNGSAP